MNALILLLTLAADPAPSTAPRAVIGGDETVMVGRMARITAKESENAVSYKWLVRPKPDDMEISGDKGSDLRISHREAAVFEIELIIGATGGETDVQFSELEFKGGAAQGPPAEAVPARAAASPSLADTIAALKQLRELQDLLQPPHPAAMPSTLAMMGHPMPPPGSQLFPDTVRVVANRVKSATRPQEARILSGCYRMVANQIKTGTFSGVDPWQSAEVQAREALGAAYPPWKTYFAELDEVLDSVEKQGHLANPESQIKFLEETAKVLGSL